MLARRPSSHLLCIAPTGSGKSLIYEQRTAVPGTRTLLISPLVALARQQASRLKASGIAVSHSGETPGSGTAAWIVSPETLTRFQVPSLLERWRPNFLVVDECHCLWDWGEEFRPAFQRLPELIERHSIPRSLWLTATLPEHARKSLREQLPSGLQEMGSFEIPENLFLSVKRVPWAHRASALIEWMKLHAAGEPGIVFTATREGSARVGLLLEALGAKVSVYHAGLGSEERRAIESRVREKKVEVVVATSAFGMGMDYPHLKWVVLWQAPLSLLGLAQAIGRVGRASSRGRALVFWDPEDFRLLEWAALRSPRRRQELLFTLEFFNSSGCRKAALRRYFEARSGGGACGARCDWCAYFGEIGAGGLLRRES